MSYIYVITNDINGKQYVGKTNKTIGEHFIEHISCSKNKNKYEKRPLYNAMNKYGIDHFSISQLEKCDESIANEREQYWIKKLNTYGNTGYNATLGGDGQHYYNYQEIAEKYCELQNQRETAKYFDCNVHTVKSACDSCGIETKSSSQVNREKDSKQVAMLDNETEDTIQIFDSISAAARFVQKPKGMGNITRVCKGKGETAYGYRWKFI